VDLKLQKLEYTATELWNGTSWTLIQQDLQQQEQVSAGAGTQTAALGFGGILTW
jgi:hypothetical protein